MVCAIFHRQTKPSANASMAMADHFVSYNGVRTLCVLFLVLVIDSVRKFFIKPPANATRYSVWIGANVKNTHLMAWSQHFVRAGLDGQGYGVKQVNIHPIVYFILTFWQFYLHKTFFCFDQEYFRCFNNGNFKDLYSCDIGRYLECSNFDGLFSFFFQQTLSSFT